MKVHSDRKTWLDRQNELGPRYKSLTMSQMISWQQHEKRQHFH